MTRYPEKRCSTYWNAINDASRHLKSRVALARRKQKLDGLPSNDRGVALAGSARPNNPYSIEVLQRAIDILSAFNHSRTLMSLAEIVQTVGLPKTTVFRILSSLVARGFCEWDATGEKYSLGFELVRLDVDPRPQDNRHYVGTPLVGEARKTAH